MKGVQTLFDAFTRTLYRLPKYPMMAVRHKNTYQWRTFQEVADQAEHFSYGGINLELFSEA